MFGPTYDIEANKITIHEGTKEELLQKGVRENHITDNPNQARTYGLNLSYQVRRKQAKENGRVEAVEELNNSIIAAGKSLIDDGSNIKKQKMSIQNGKIETL